MIAFTSTFLVAVHRVTVEYTALGLSVLRICLNPHRIRKLASTVCQHHLEQHFKAGISQNPPQPPEYFTYGSGRVSLPKGHQLQVTVGEQDC